MIKPLKDQKPQLGLYVHWPFCRKKCPYCDFNSHIDDKPDHQRWAECFALELEYMAQLSGRASDELSSIFIGGGTPSLMAPTTIEKIINHAQNIFKFANNIEITMEANPTSVEATKLAAFSSVGVNRLSMGIQSLDDDALALLGREHSSREALSALDIGRSIFPRVSADFIYARPKQRLTHWEKELERILALRLSHLSLYQLTLEKGTAFYNLHQRGKFNMPSTDAARDFYDLTQVMTVAAGCPAYEISNHALKGEESLHNMIYWQAQDWIGIGPGAYGRFWLNGNRAEIRSRRAPQSWLQDVENKRNAIDQEILESPLDYAFEALLMGLRLHQGVNLQKIAQHAGQALEWITSWLDKTQCQYLTGQHLIKYDGRFINLTDKGRPLLNSIINQIMKH